MNRVLHFPSEHSILVPTVSLATSIDFDLPLQAIVRFQFQSRAEFVHIGAAFVFREGNTKGIGKILDVGLDG